MKLNNIAFLFVPKITDFKGMGKNFAKDYPEAKTLLNDADEFFEQDISSFFLKGYDCSANPDSKIFLLPYVAGCLFSTLLSKNDIDPGILMGSGFGIFASIFSAKSISFEKSNLLIKTFFQSVFQDSLSLKKSSVDILGIDTKNIISIIDKSLPKNSVQISHFNAPHQFTVSGTEPYISKLIDLVASMGGISSNATSIDFLIHTDSLKLSPLFNKTVTTLNLNNPNVPVFSDTEVKLLNSGKEIQAALASHFTKPVLFEQSIRVLIAKGINFFIEIGGSGTLSKLIRWIDRKVRIHSIQDRLSFEETLRLFKQK